MARVEAPFAIPTPRGVRLLLAALTFIAAGVSSLLLVWQLLLESDARRRFLLQDVSDSTRASTFGACLALGVLLPIIGMAVVGSRKRVDPERELVSLSRLIAPATLAAFTPLLFDWHIGQEHPLTYLLSLCLFALAARRLLTISIEELRQRRLARDLPLVRASAVLPGWLGFVVVFVAAAAYCAYTAYFTIQHHHQIGTTAFDLGIYDNLLYNALHGRFFHSPVLFGPGNENYLAGHAELAMVFFVPFYAIHPDAETLLIIQSVLLGFAAVPLYLFASRVLTRATAVVLCFAYLLFAPLHGPHFYDFHWLPLQIFFHFWLYYSLVAHRKWLTVFSLVMLFAIREDIAVGLCLLGVFLIVTGLRPRFGLFLAPFAALWFVFDKFILMPSMGSWHFEGLYTELFADGRASFGAVIVTLVTNPIYALTTFVRAVKLEYGLHMVAPLALLPLYRLPFLLILMPATVFTVMTTGYWPTTQISFQYTTHWIPYLFLATVLALASMRREFAGDSRRLASIAVIAICSLSHSFNFGAVLQRESFRGGFGKVSFEMPPEAKKRYADLMSLVKRIPITASVAATEAVNPHISSRLDAYAFRYDFGPVDYMLFSKYEAATPDQHQVLVNQVNKVSYQLVAKAGEFYLFKRGPSTPETLTAWRELNVRVNDR